MTNISSKRILVTGSSGFIGKNLINIGESMGLNFTRLDESGDVDIKCDITKADWEEIPLSDFDFVVHLAAKTSVAESIEDPELYRLVNSEATESLFRACSESGIRRVVFASSAAVYGDSQAEVKIIGQEGEPLSPYASTKLDGERFASNFSSPETSFVCLRFFNVYGPFQKSDSDYSAVIPAFIRSSIDGGGLEIHGDGKQTRDFIHVKDVSDSIISSLSADLSEFSIFNVASGISTSVNDLANSLSGIIGLFGKEIPEQIFVHSRKGDVRHSKADISGLDELLELESLINIEEGLFDLVKRTLDESNT